MFLLRSCPCLTGCEYCDQALDVHQGLKRFFGFDAYRAYAGEPLQEKAVQAAVDNKSLLAVFPTGGGKSITFQVPALMSGINTKGTLEPGDPISLAILKVVWECKWKIEQLEMKSRIFFKSPSMRAQDIAHLYDAT